MRKNLKYLLLLLIIYAGVICAGFIMRSLFSLHYSGRELAVLTSVFTIISAISLIVFFRGSGREQKEQVFHSLTAVSVKFLAELIVALVWFMIAKKSSAEYVILFFVLYLSFSMFSFGLMLKTLKNKSLHRDTRIENN